MESPIINSTDLNAEPQTAEPLTTKTQTAEQTKINRSTRPSLVRLLTSILIYSLSITLSYIFISQFFGNYTINSLSFSSENFEPTFSNYLTAYFSEISVNPDLLILIFLIISGFFVFQILLALLLSRIPAKKSKIEFFSHFILLLIFSISVSMIGFRESQNIAQRQYEDEINNLIYEANKYDSFPEVLSDNSEIVEKFKVIATSSDEHPEIILSDLQSARFNTDLIKVLNTRLKDRGEYYRTAFSQNNPNIIDLDLSKEAVFMIDQTLYVNYPTVEVFGEINDLVAYHIFENYFNTDKKFPAPKIQNLTYDQFKVERQIEIAAQIDQLENLIDIIDSAVREYQSFITKYRGYYNQTGDVFYLNLVKELEAEVKYFKEEREYAEDAISTLQDRLLSEPPEIGLFYRPDKIKIVLGENKNDTPSCYIDTLLHEYLHYASAYGKKDSQFLPTGYEEGLTAYLTNDAMLAYFGDTACSVSYELNYSIIEEMLEEVKLSDFIRAFMNKDEKYLETTLNAKFGKDFYKKSLFRMNYFAIVGWDDDAEAYFLDLLEEIKD